MPRLLFCQSWSVMVQARDFDEEMENLNFGGGKVIYGSRAWIAFSAVSCQKNRKSFPSFRFTEHNRVKRQQDQEKAKMLKSDKNQFSMFIFFFPSRLCVCDQLHIICLKIMHKTSIAYNIFYPTSQRWSPQFMNFVCEYRSVCVCVCNLNSIIDQLIRNNLFEHKFDICRQIMSRLLKIISSIYSFTYLFVIRSVIFFFPPPLHFFFQFIFNIESCALMNGALLSLVANVSLSNSIGIHSSFFFHFCHAIFFLLHCMFSL